MEMSRHVDLKITRLVEILRITKYFDEGILQVSHKYGVVNNASRSIKMKW